MKPFRPAPARVPFLSRARTLHRDRLSCAPGAASVHSRPFPGFPTKPGCDSFLSPSSDLFSHDWEMDSHR